MPLLSSRSCPDRSPARWHTVRSVSVSFVRYGACHNATSNHRASECEFKRMSRTSEGGTPSHSKQTRQFTRSRLESGFGSAANGGELLCLAMATCYCNDIYREAAKRAMDIIRVQVEASAEFGEPGAPASQLSYSVTVFARAPEGAIDDLIRYTDGVAEVQNTLRQGIPVRLAGARAISVGGP
jgi:organic hydroperoxide reductase OsmC/OhrA